jgi:hypothetical protein
MDGGMKTAEQVCAELGGGWQPANAPFDGGLRHAGGASRGVEIERPSGIADWLLRIWLWDQAEGGDPDDGQGLVCVVVYRTLTEAQAAGMPQSRNSKYVMEAAHRQGGCTKCDERIHSSRHYVPLALGEPRMVEAALAEAAQELYMALQVVKGSMTGFIPSVIRQT